MNQRILITGGSGLLGSYLVRWFKQKGYTHITSTYQHSIDTVPKDILEGVHWEKLILPDKAAALEIVSGHDWVIHAAGFVSYQPKDKYKLIDINQTGTEHIVNACLTHHVEHFVYISSIGALGKENDHVTLKESSPWLQNEFSTSYGLSKYLGEVEAWRGAAEGLNVSVVVPSVILGAGDWQKSSLQIMDQIVKKSAWYPGGKTGYVDVRDIVLFIDLLLERSVIGERWILNSADLSYAELYKKVAANLGLKRKFRESPKWLAKIILLSRNLVKTGSIGVELLHHVYGTFTYDASKSMTMEGFSYRNIDETLKEVAENYMRSSKDILHSSVLPLRKD
jgi:dihydroflavonol-4-reductase